MFASIFKAPELKKQDATKAPEDLLFRFIQISTQIADCAQYLTEDERVIVENNLVNLNKMAENGLEADFTELEATLSQIVSEVKAVHGLNGAAGAAM